MQNAMRGSFWHVQEHCTLDILLDSFCLRACKNLGQKGYGDIKHVGTGALRCTFCDIHCDYKAQVCSATHLHAMCTVFTRRRSAVRHTSMRSAQYLQRGGLLWDTPPRDLHDNYQCFQALYLFRRCALRHTSSRSAQFLQVFVGIGHVFF
jgi:hypothetical protein